MNRILAFIEDNIDSESFFCFTPAVPRLLTFKALLSKSNLKTVVLLPPRDVGVDLKSWAQKQQYGVSSNISTLKRSDYFKVNKVLFTTQSILINDLFSLDDCSFDRIIYYEPNIRDVHLKYIAHFLASARPECLVQAISFNFQNFVDRHKTCEMLAAFNCKGLKLLPFGDIQLQNEISNRKIDFKSISVNLSKRAEKIITLLNDLYIRVLTALCKNLLIPVPENFNAFYDRRFISDYLHRNGVSGNYKNSSDQMDHLWSINRALFLFNRCDYLRFNVYVNINNKHFTDEIINLALELIYRDNKPLTPINYNVEATIYIAEHLKKNYKVICHPEEVSYFENLEHLFKKKYTPDMIKKALSVASIPDFMTFLSDKKISFSIEKFSNDLVGSISSFQSCFDKKNSVYTFDAEIDELDLSDTDYLILTHPNARFMRSLYFTNKHFKDIFVLEHKSDTLSLSTFDILQKELEDSNFLKLVDVMKVFKPKAFEYRQTNNMTVVVDKREFKSNLAIELFMGGFTVKPAVLQIGDYILSKHCAVERKSVNDFISSVYSGRLREQVFYLSNCYSFPIVLIEGNDKLPLLSLHDSMNNTILYKLVALYKLYPTLRIVYSGSPNGTVKIFKAVAEETDDLLSYATSVVKASQFEDALSQINLLSFTSAHKVSTGFKTFGRLCAATRDEIEAKVPGTGYAIHNFLHTPIRPKKTNK